MADTRYAYDGFVSLRGQWGGNPDAIPVGYADQAVNRLFREDFNRTRWSIQSIELEFENDAERIFFQGGNGQGAFFYNSYPTYLYPSVMCSVGGRIYRIEVIGRKGRVTKLWDGNYRQGLHAWFAQGFEYLFVQDGVNPPVIWDGQNPARRSDPVKNEMPVGSVMAFIHGRMVVASSDGLNNIRISEIAGAAAVDSRADIYNFPPVLPTYSIAANLGEVQGLYPMPYLDSGTGQYELVALCRAGFTTFDFRGPEETLLGDVQKISLVGTGCVGSHAFAPLNSDLIYRDDSGINSYRNSRLEYTQQWDQTPISREVDYWIQQDRADLLETIPMVGWQNMVFTGCAPAIEVPSNLCFGYHRFCRGFVVFDAQSMSTAGRDGKPVWHGMWTGIRPWAFAQGRIGNADRCFAFSFDRDGRNRLYEVTRTQADDFFGNEGRRIFSYFSSATLGSVEAITSTFKPKKWAGGQLELSGLLKSASVNVDFRPDGSACWVLADSFTVGCDCPEQECIQGNQPPYARRYLQSPAARLCVEGTSQPANVFFRCQTRMRFTGNVTVDRFQVKMDIGVQDAQTVNCELGLGKSCEPITCCPGEYDYAYHIAPAGVNGEVPALECPRPAQNFVSTRYYRAVCPNDPSISAVAQGQGESTISQNDADQKALAAAQENAEAALNCPNCITAELFRFVIDGGNQNLSEFFISGEYFSYLGQPWRLVDVPTQQYIAYGIVNDSGTLITTATYPQYTHGSFDPATNVYTDNGGGQTTIALEIGCNVGGNLTWPSDTPPY